VQWGAATSTAAILQLLIDGGGSVNEASNEGLTPLIAVASANNGDAAARLDVLLARPELDLDAKCRGKTAEEWARQRGHPELAAAIAAEVCPVTFVLLQRSPADVVTGWPRVPSLFLWLFHNPLLTKLKSLMSCLSRLCCAQPSCQAVRVSFGVAVL
jgi:hypothetical protein